MTWQQITCQTTSTHQHALSDLLETAGAASVTLQDAADQPLLEPLPGETPLWDHIIVTGLFPASQDLTGVLLQLELQRAAWSLATIRLETLEDRPWVREWMDQFQPMRFGERLWIYPSWTTPPEDADIKILLDPGLAFGTGTHPTTALCLAWLDGADLAGKTVLDYGCGSGILAIAALKLGAAGVLAVDIDPQALQATAENARRNGIEPGTALLTALPDECRLQTYDVVIANILANPLVKLAPALLGALRPGGQLALSGILATQEDLIQQAYRPALQQPVVTLQDEWICFSGNKV
ncbi:MAG: 50S ribosomal protein L11 methyltransferase [Thiothrix sp.]|nr:50S ribosomal protein L11 methyltransferase [Thiothrix sp.]HPE60540.1 50S ribosomal protein L11 methyltransferase [Thiolinea sp.]